ncbi:MAG: hypothetical protein HXX08_24355 [Chloroflexi bacterium]|uniref:Uncharacterized protein n=1 Tax=Candidatus Chlorohelix allophototropha TaxID=3003348 RepID=A0A8T7MAF4_9CHLR|nr:hypothetical protein [Chloroflexota bacterium]WJW68935.1 hypothetical protein OZ401_004557 [Chloroflexota bacterium L227-S17]
MINRESGKYIQNLVVCLKEASGQVKGDRELTAKWEEAVNEAQMYLSQTQCSGCSRTLDECIAIPCPEREAVAAD